MPALDMAWLRRRGGGFVVLGALGWVAMGIGFAVDVRRSFYAYLTAYTWTVALAVGALCFLAIVNAMNATWPVAVRRLAEGLAATLPLFAVLFVPIFVGMSRLYPWLTPELFRDARAHDLIMHRRAYYNVPFYVVRWAIIFAVWCVFAWLFRAWSLQQEHGQGETLRHRLCVTGAAALIPLGITLSVASFDWLMSLEPTWYSTIYGLYFLSGCMLGGAALVSVVAVIVRRVDAVAQLQPSHFHALGRVLLAFTALWGYLAFFQYMLIWIANRPREGEWFVHRAAGSWRAVSIALVVGHFVVPFMLLLSYRLKRMPGFLLLLGLWIIAFRYVEAYWLVIPAYWHLTARPSWIDLAAMCALLGSSGACAVWLLRRRPLFPVGDPALARALKYDAQ